MWLTNKKTGAKFNTDWLKEDEKLKEYQIAINKEQADILNGKKSDTAQTLSLEEKKQMIYDFADRTGVNVNIMGVNEVPDDTFQMILGTVEEQINKYELDNFILNEIQMRDDIDFDDTVMATMSHTGKLSLNPAYFKRSKAELDEIQQESLKTSHSVGATAEATIIHELGHARFFKTLTNDWKKYQYDEFGTAYQEWEEIYNACDGWGSGSEGFTFKSSLYRNKKFYHDFLKRIDDFTTRLQDSEYLRKRWGGSVNLSLRGIVDPTYNYIDGISKYAGKNIHEMMAEAWTDVELNGDKASWMSKQVYDEFLKIKK